MNGKNFDNAHMWALDDRDRPTDTEIEFPCGQIHNITGYWQFQDKNTLYEQLKTEHESRGYADSDNPHPIGDIRIGPDDTLVNIGFFPKGTDHGHGDGAGNYAQNQSFIINLYDDIDNGEITSTLGKSRIVVAERDLDLIQKDGSQFTWPSGYKSKDRYEGSNIHVNTSNVSSLAEVIGRARSIFVNSTLEIDFDTYLRRWFIDETFRFANPEVYHRFRNQYLKSVKDTIRQSARLVRTDDDDGEFEAGYDEIVGFSTDRINQLGFDVDVSVGALSKSIPSSHLKVYRTKNPERYKESNCLYHPKVEIEAHKAYPAPLFDEVVHRLDAILNTHLYDFAGVERSDLVQDRYYDGADEETVCIKSPKEYRSRLMEFYASDLFEKNVYQYISRPSTNTPKYMLFLLDQNGYMTYSQLSNMIGVTKKTIAKWGHRMKDDGICRIVPGITFGLELVDTLRDRVTKMIIPGKTIGEFRREIRKANQDQNTPVNESHSVDGGVPHTSPIANVVVTLPMDQMGETAPEILRAPGPP